MERSFDGTISWVRSINTGREFPLLVFRADVDYATSGLASLSSVSRPEVVAVFLTEDEFNADASSCEQRINLELSRDDLRLPRFLRSQDTFDGPANVSFQEYMKRSTPPRLIYSDIYDPDGEAEVVREESIEEFVKGGGILLDRVADN